MATTKSTPISLGPALEIPKDKEQETKMKLGQLVNSKEALQRLVQKELPVKVAYRLVKFIKQAESELEIFEEQRTKLIYKYGEEKDGKVTVLPENSVAFTDEVMQLLNMEIDLIFEPLSLETLGDIEITTSDLILLGYLIKDE